MDPSTSVGKIAMFEQQAVPTEAAMYEDNVNFQTSGNLQEKDTQINPARANSGKDMKGNRSGHVELDSCTEVSVAGKYDLMFHNYERPVVLGECHLKEPTASSVKSGALAIDYDDPKGGLPVHLKVHQTTDMYGICVPKTVQEAYELDKESGNTLWEDAIKKEMGIIVAMHLIKKDGEVVPSRFIGGFRYHVVFDLVKEVVIRRRAQLVLGHQVTELVIAESTKLRQNTNAAQRVNILCQPMDRRGRSKKRVRVLVKNPRLYG